MKTLLFSLIFLSVLAVPMAAGSGKPIAKTIPPAATVFSSQPGTQRQSFTVKCTGYDLSYQSCEKLPSHPAYGITASGLSLKGKSRESAMAIATDPAVIPTGTKVLLVFKDKARQKYNGYYTAVDIGSAIKGNRIDIFFGDFGEKVSTEALAFGISTAEAFF